MTLTNEFSIKQAQKIVDEWINQFKEGYWPPSSMLASLMEEVWGISKRNKRKREDQEEKRK